MNMLENMLDFISKSGPGVMDAHSFIAHDGNLLFVGRAPCSKM